MSKPITVKSCAYIHAEDIDPEAHMSAPEVEAAKDNAVNLATAALENEADGYSPFLRANLQTIFDSMQATHGTIRKVLGFGWEDPRSIDALALARIPLEHLYTLCLMFEKPVWVEVYLKDGWKKQYERFLLQREETKKLPRFDGFSNELGPKNLELHRKAIGITDSQKATVEHVELGTAIPDHMTSETIPHFPTPSRVINALPQGDKRRMLERLYPEYVFYCSFVHGLPDSLLFRVMFNKNSRIPRQFDDDSVKETFRRHVELPSYSTSLISIVQSVSELTALYPADVALKGAVTQAWDKIIEGMLLGRVVWNLRTRKLLGVIR
jgi:hypothetical protein